jgi:hypothetical protein
MATTLTINGEQNSFDTPADMPLLWVLRDVLGMTGTKFGCGGACTVHIDGKPERSCMLRWARCATAPAVSSTPRPLDSIINISGILDHPNARVMTTESVARVRIHQT